MRRTFNFLFNLGEEVKEKQLSIGFLIDLSGSMQGEPLYNLKNALLQILNPLVQFNPSIKSSAAIPAADEVMLMTFATEVQKVCPWVNEGDYDFFKELLLTVPEAIFGKSGCTALYDGVYSILSEFTKTKKDNEKILIIFSDGGEYGSKRKKSEITNQIKKFKQGFLTSSQYDLFLTKIDKNELDNLVDKIDEDYVFKKNFLSDIETAKIEEIFKKEIIEFYRNSVNNVNIYSLLYVGGGFAGNKALLTELADLTGGLVYDSPQEETIPTILNEMVMDILYEDNPSFRTKLFRKLNDSTDKPLHKLISFNTTSENLQDASFSNNYDNPVYYISVKELENENKSRDAYKGLFSKIFKEKIYSDFKKCIEDNSKKLNEVPNINSQLNMLVVLRGNDKIGISAAEFLIKNIRSNIPQLIDPATKVWTKIVLLLEKFKDYSDQEKQELYAFLNEINSTELDEIHTVYLISDYNKYAHNSNSGFIYLQKHQFEDLAAEILFDLNINQALDNKIIGGTVDQMGESSRFVAIGGTSAYLKKEEYISTLTNIFTANFLTNLFNKIKLPFDENLVNERLQTFLNQISYEIISKKLIDCHPQTEDMFQQLSCPSTSQFTPYRDEISLKIFNKSNPELEKISISRKYFNFVEYITLLYYDIIDYIDSCHSIEFFESELDRRLDVLFKAHYAKLKSSVDYLLYGNNNSSSPLASKEFIDKLFSNLVETLKSRLDLDFQNDQIKKELDHWQFTNSEGVKMPPGNPSEDINELRKQIENFPLPWSIRFRYGSFGALLGGVSLSVLWLSGFGSIELLIGLLPALVSIVFGEYKVRMVYKKLQNIINKYENTHKYYTWQKAFGIYCEKIKNFYEALKEKVKRENVVDDDPFLLNQYSENEMIDLFAEAVNKSIPNLVLREEGQNADLDRFHISLQPYILNNLYKYIDDKDSEGRIELKSDIVEEMKKLGLDLKRIENSKQLLIDLLSSMKTINLKEFPSVLIGPIPIKFENLSPGLQSKIDLIPITKDREYLFTLLQNLTEDEKKELIEIWKEDYWKNTVEELILLRNQQNSVENNLFVLWRDIVRYEIWLRKIKDLIKKSITNQGELESKFNFDNIFYAWKDFFSARKKFTEGLNELFSKIAKQIVDSSFDLWKIILGLKHYTNIHSSLNGNSYPVLSVITTNVSEYPRILNYYSANESLNKTNLQKDGIDLENSFPAKTTTNDWEFHSLSLDNDQVIFNKIYYLNLRNIEKYSIFYSILETFKKRYNIDEYSDVFQKIKNDKDTLELFLEDFRNSYLNSEKNIKKYRFIGEVN